MTDKTMVVEKRNYIVKTSDGAKNIAIEYLSKSNISTNAISFGLPEINDRYNTWKVPVLSNCQFLGDIIINAFSGDINKGLSSEISIIQKRIDSAKKQNHIKEKGQKKENLLFQT